MAGSYAVSGTDGDFCAVNSFFRTSVSGQKEPFCQHEVCFAVLCPHRLVCLCDSFDEIELFSVCFFQS
jgi:hypothetical protein